MAVNKGTNITGYVFPNIPGNWSPEEKRFALALRGLFDQLFQKTRGLQSDFDKSNYERLANKPAISGVILTGNKSLADLGIHNVNDDAAGLMTPTMLAKLNGIEAGATKGPDSRPGVDYLSMMSGIDILTDTSDKVEKVAGYYEAETWNEKMVWDAVEKWITATDYEDITGEPYSPFHD